MSFLGSLLPSSLRSDLLPSSSSSSPGAASSHPLLPPSSSKTPRKSSTIRSQAELDASNAAASGGTFPAFPFPALTRPQVKERDELELGGSAASAGRSRWTRTRLANAVYVAVFWALVLCWLRALGGYGAVQDE